MMAIAVIILSSSDHFLFESCLIPAPIANYRALLLVYRSRSQTGCLSELAERETPPGKVETSFLTSIGRQYSSFGVYIQYRNAYEREYSWRTSNGMGCVAAELLAC